MRPSLRGQNQGDLLTSYNGQNIYADDIGNMLSDEEWLYTWEHGRQLVSMYEYNNDEYGWEFTYDADGMRTKRSDGSTTYEYVYNGSQLSYMTVDGNTLQFIYSATGAPMAVIYNGDYYYYLTNIQGDVIALLDTDATTVVTYTYDAWGNVTVSGPMDDDLGIHNPLRYRGYVYDEETGLYYLQSRYYNPAMGRFINADALVSTGQGILGYNMFVYCLNNPVGYVDNCGNIGTSIPLVTNGLNLPAGGGFIIKIDGTIYQYAIKYNSQGELYEYWFDATGNLVWVRHHSTHKMSHNHTNPHDHEGTKDDRGNNTEKKPPLPPNDKFHSPEESTSIKQITKNYVVGYDEVGNAVGAAVTIYVIYQAGKWIIATLLAPATGGASYGVAAATP